MLGVMRDILRVAMAPDRVNWIGNLPVPIDQRSKWHWRTADDNTRFLKHFTSGRFIECFLLMISRASHRLPETWVVGTLDEQHLKLGGVDNNEGRFR
ncbi:hypothetical protein BGZ96_002962 [Linnemannia gamsii]|uniref:Uncharacterized protein n=1 Tax=Linnemannia gamsii TaxID=64522 RepID=A0ABQ7KFW9_9FUNG|nr:hypothetical protein BGZ96_002962 [Linnemannia gamsii]